MSNQKFPLDVIMVAGKKGIATEVIVNEVLGQDPFPDSYFTITTAGAIGDTIRVQIAATVNDSTSPDRDTTATDVTYTLVAADVGDELKLRDNVITSLNANSNFATHYKAQKAKDIAVVHITSKFRSMPNEFYDAPSMTITTTGTTQTVVDAGQGQILSRAKTTSLARDPDSPHRLGILGISGSVSVTPGTVSDLFIDTLKNSGSSNMLVNGSSTPVAFSVVLSSTKDIYIQRLRIVSNGNGIQFGRFLSQSGSGLTNGLLIEIKSDDQSTTLPVIKTNDDLKHKFAFPPTGFDLDIQSGRDDLTAEFQFENPFVLRKSGTFVTDDYLKITVRDNLTSGILYMEAIAFGFEKEP